MAISIKPIRNYPFRGKIYTAKQIDELIESVYTKSEIDDIVDTKQDVLTAGSGINITNNVISATGGGGGGSDWVEKSTSTDWLTGIATFDSTTNDYTLLKDVILSVYGSGASCSNAVIIPKGTKFHESAYILNFLTTYANSNKLYSYSIKAGDVFKSSIINHNISVMLVRFDFSTSTPTVTSETTTYTVAYDYIHWNGIRLYVRD